MIKRPKLIKSPKWSRVIELATQYMDAVEEADAQGYTEVLDEDLKQYVFEAAMEAVYGEAVFSEVINKMGEEDDR